MVDAPRDGEQSREERLRSSVARLAARRRRFVLEGSRTWITAAAVIGVGWSVVVPAVVGFALGHWLDVRFHAGIVFAAGAGVAGLVFGCWSAWRHLASPHEDRANRRR